MEELPFSPNIREFQKNADIGDTNKIYFDPVNPEVLIRIPTDKESAFLVSETELIKIAEKYYHELGKLGADLGIVVAPHQFVVAKEAKDGPIKPMLLAKRIEGEQLFPIDKNNPKILDAANRIAEFTLKYVDWIDRKKPKAVITDIFRLEQYLITHNKDRDILTLVDIEPRLKERIMGLDFIRTQLFNLGGILCDTQYQGTYQKILKYFVGSLLQERNNRSLTSSINMMVNFPNFYKQFAERNLVGEEPFIPSEMGQQLASARLVIDRVFLERLGIKKLNK